MPSGALGKSLATAVVGDSRRERSVKQFGWELVDLSLLISEELPASWPQGLPFQRRIWNWFQDVEDTPELLLSRNGHFFTEVIQMDEHTATHFDAPAHFLEECSHVGTSPKTGDLVPLTQLCGPACVVDIRVVESRTAPVMGESPIVEVSDLELWESEHHRIGPEEVVLFRTDWDGRFYHRGSTGKSYAELVISGACPGWPAPGVEVMEALADRGVTCVGIDTPSIGPVQDAGPVHIAGFRRGLVFVEGLARLAELPVFGAFFVFLPLKIARSSGAPGHAVAWVERGVVTPPATESGQAREVVC